MPCSICRSAERKEIEEYLSIIDTPGVQTTLKEVAEKFKVSVQELQVHALMHTPLVSELEDAEGVIPSLAAGMKKSEASMLQAVADEYWCTLRAAGKELRSRLVPATFTPDGTVAKVLPKEMVDLYIGAGNNLRQTVASIVDMNQKINGESDPAIDALKSLIQAVKGPASLPEDPEDD